MVYMTDFTATKDISPSSLNMGRKNTIALKKNDIKDQ